MYSPSTTESLLARLASRRSLAAVTFAGQGVEVLPELVAIIDRWPEARARIEVAAARLRDLARTPLGEASGRFRYGVDVTEWVDDPDGAPPDWYLRSGAVSYPLVLMTQLLVWDLLLAEGFGAVVDAGAMVAVTGHSQGLLAALTVAEDPSRPIDDERLIRYLGLAFHQGLHQARHATGASPMAAVTGVRLARLTPLVDEVNASVAPDQAVVVGLVNAPDRVVVSGPPATLERLHTHLRQVASDETALRRSGRRGGAPLQFGWTPLPVDVPFHWPGLGPAVAEQRRWLAAERPLPSPDQLAVPVLSPVDGSDLRHCRSLDDVVARGLVVEPVRWDRTVRRLVDLGADWIIDLGPGTDVAHLTGSNLRGSGARSLPLATPEGWRILTTRGAAPAGPDVRYANFAPGLVELPDGRRHLDNRYTRATGQPPIVLPGMTPTTADVPLVAAAANAGWTAELAGGGQPTAAVFRERMAELGEQLAAGAGCVLNTLYLDRHLWNLHVDRPGLLFDAKRSGAPLLGLTVSAGVPEVEEAVRLLDRLVAVGLIHNSFKPGTVQQVRQVLAIADAAPHHTVFVHLEGGKAGGHHSFEDLDELLLATYDELRRRPNLVVCVGGGVGTPQRAAELLTGAWSARWDAPPMPVDAVLVGTAAMACAEAAASPQVKRALVEAPGTTAWVPRRGRAGGVYSGRSNLNADIHALDNTAARVADVLLAVAGDSAAVQARRDELIDALSRTAKPYFGDVAAMTYTELLGRFTELCAVGRHGRYDDGAWGDPTWRARAVDLYRRAAGRLGREAAADLDNPAGALVRFRQAYPAADHTLVHPADAQAFVELCDEPGKPVPFVPVLDGEVRRWYMADALWPAQDDRFDADAVLVIPGPEAVAGITRAGEPVADLLARFEQVALARLEAEGVRPVHRDRLSDAGLAPAPFPTLAQSHSGPLAALCVTPRLERAP
ncbi:MAG TPA: fatty acid synthase subunit beta domain-containing protein, partial [Acidimicrobiales bacterium]